jgi:hypothetical protein
MRRASCLLAVAAVVAASTADASFLSSDPVRGATLLLPYFEVDLDSPNGGDTTFRIHNGQATRAAVAHVTLWTDWAIPTFAFDIVLNVSEQREVFLREVFNGRIPAPSSPFVALPAQAQGVSLSGCSSSVIDAATIAHIRAAHTGQASALFLGQCSGVDHGDNLARGFVTVDITSDCAGDAAPSSPDYFGEDGVAGNSNSLWGYYAITDRGSGTAFGEMMLPIEANANVSGATFYSEFAGTGSADLRERFSPTWGASFIGGEDSGTDVILWRDPLVASEPVACGNSPIWFPLIPADVTLSNADGDTIGIPGFSPFPAATNRIRIGSDDFPTIYDSGFLRVELPAFELATTNGILSPLGPQGHMTVVHYHGPGRTSAHRGTDLRVPPE